MARGLLLLLALLGCRATPDDKAPVGTDPDTGVGEVPDEDGDGFSEEEGDCDERDGNVHPGASEACNGVDDDCDGSVDEGVLGTYYADADGDGYGDPAAPQDACASPAGHVSVGVDCDDTDPEVFPSSPEVCDGIDNDCDALVDEDVSDTWYADADGDGVGDPAAAVTTCARPEGYVEVGADCDDTSATAFPGNAEACDEQDNDCDGTVDEGVTTTWDVDFDGDAHGDGTLTQEACAQPTGYAAADDDCDDTVATTFPGAVESCNAVDDNCDGAVDEGVTSVFYADADGDGHGDASRTAASCAAPSGYVAVGDDCDDTRASTAPGATERCNDRDDDCDGTIDEADAADATTWYIDYDGDGYGSGRSSVVACDAPAAYVGNDDDCDDTRAAVHTVSPETCNGLDDDCD
ncbi:MAG: MopE-related protein, partial [Myxococcota bacterium]